MQAGGGASGWWRIEAAKDDAECVSAGTSTAPTVVGKLKGNIFCVGLVPF
jgi:hypothetical protein